MLPAIHDWFWTIVSCNNQWSPWVRLCLRHLGQGLAYKRYSVKEWISEWYLYDWLNMWALKHVYLMMSPLELDRAGVIISKLKPGPIPGFSRATGSRQQRWGWNLSLWLWAKQAPLARPSGSTVVWLGCAHSCHHLNHRLSWDIQHDIGNHSKIKTFKNNQSVQS